MAFLDKRIIESSETSVKKIILVRNDAIAETVLYRYPTYAERTVICCSTMSGCPVGCRFCGAGDHFVRNFSADDIVGQVEAALEEAMRQEPETTPNMMQRLQIMFMSMGEPLLNRRGLEGAIRILHERYPDAALLVSSIGPDVHYDWFISLAEEIPTIGLQFSVHKSKDAERNELIPFKSKLDLHGIASIGKRFHEATARFPFFNYCAADDNTHEEDADRLANLFAPDIWKATVSVICERNEGMPARNPHQENLARSFSEKLIARGFDVRVFDPAGQDDIGGGCGQLWFVQDWMKRHPHLARPTIGHDLPKVHVPAGAV